MQEVVGSTPIFSTISPYKIIYPIIIGLAVVSYMLYKEFDIKAFEEITFSWNSVAWLVVAILCMGIRDLGYVIRIRVLSGDRLSWLQSLRIIFLWEFTSAVTPSAIGGTSIAILFVNKEGIKVGRSSAIVMATSFLDELYFILMFPLILIFVNHNQLWNIPGASTAVIDSLFWFAIIGYSIKLLYLLILSYGLFKNPRGLKYLIMKCFKLRILSPLLGGECDSDGLLGRPLRLGPTFLDFCPATRDVDHDVGESYSGRKRLCGICIFQILG